MYAACGMQDAVAVQGVGAKEDAPWSVCEDGMVQRKVCSLRESKHKKGAFRRGWRVVHHLLFFPSLHICRHWPFITINILSRLFKASTTNSEWSDEGYGLFRSVCCCRWFVHRFPPYTDESHRPEGGACSAQSALDRPACCDARRAYSRQERGYCAQDKRYRAAERVGGL